MQHPLSGRALPLALPSALQSLFTSSTKLWVDYRLNCLTCEVSFIFSVLYLLNVLKCFLNLRLQPSWAFVHIARRCDSSHTPTPSRSGVDTIGKHASEDPFLRRLITAPRQLSLDTRIPWHPVLLPRYPSPGSRHSRCLLSVKILLMKLCSRKVGVEHHQNTTSLGCLHACALTNRTNHNTLYCTATSLCLNRAFPSLNDWSRMTASLECTPETSIR